MVQYCIISSTISFTISYMYFTTLYHIWSRTSKCIHLLGIIICNENLIAMSMLSFCIHCISIYFNKLWSAVMQRNLETCIGFCHLFVWDYSFVASQNLITCMYWYTCMCAYCISYVTSSSTGWSILEHRTGMPSEWNQQTSKGFACDSNHLAHSW